MERVIITVLGTIIIIIPDQLHMDMVYITALTEAGDFLLLLESHG